MIGTPILKDVFKYKAKFIARFTAKQILFLGLGLVLLILMLFMFGFPKKTDGDTIYYFKVFIICVLRAIPTVPIFLFGFYEPYGMSLKDFIVKAIVPYFKNPAVRKGEDKSTDKVMVARRRHPSKVKRSKEFKAVM